VQQSLSLWRFAAVRGLHGRGWIRQFGSVFDYDFDGNTVIIKTARRARPFKGEERCPRGSGALE